MGINRNKKHKEVQNLLSMVPLLKDGLTMDKRNGNMIVFVPRQSWVERQAVRFLKQPAVIQVRLDDLGAAVTTMCDGNHSVSDIAAAIQAEFGDDAEPLLPRLVKFIELMEVNNWLEWSSGQ
ncbi:PqqD family protein [Paenibacillus sp. N3/727]|uniref:PqqD family protein n=1 Tax=Paenibacillus sp. N3/727 TaxID=2925845 RepID=UPI001F53A467|nr:PqqD family protein [Paenibacillus sp. N3/727]UNK16619.1 PqqD family protein [Paenibacillus sp. N3/727]